MSKLNICHSDTFISFGSSLSILVNRYLASIVTLALGFMILQSTFFSTTSWTVNAGIGFPDLRLMPVIPILLIGALGILVLEYVIVMVLLLIMDMGWNGARRLGWAKADVGLEQ
jgi:hypothetical protein